MSEKKSKSQMKRENVQAARPMNEGVNDKAPLIAKKDFRITQNEYDRQIKAGEEISGVPERFHANLKLEGVI